MVHGPGCVYVPTVLVATQRPDLSGQCLGAGPLMNAHGGDADCATVLAGANQSWPVLGLRSRTGRNLVDLCRRSARGASLDQRKHASEL